MGSPGAIISERVEETRPIRVTVAIGNDVLRAGIVAIIGQLPVLTVSEMSVDTATFADRMQADRPDVLLVDIEMAATLCQILREHSDATLTSVAVAALSTQNPPDLSILRELIRYGINGIVAIEDSATQLKAAIHAVFHRQSWISPGIGGYLLDALKYSGSARLTPPYGAVGMTLTQRECVILALVADGLTVHQIAKRLHRSESAVKYHLSNMSARYQARNRAHLVHLAIQAGQLPID